MNTYDITIQATVTKTITVTSESMDSAEEAANELFDVRYDAYSVQGRERYTQDIIRAELTNKGD